MRHELTTIVSFCVGGGKQGFNDQEIVALSGAHTLGRAFSERSGTVEQGYGSKSVSAST